ncbi:dirigent protein 5-like [Punica granatum]|nr:dirigent protein 5-like [Punica granatum]
MEKFSSIFFLVFLLVFSESAVPTAGESLIKRNAKPCQRLMLHLHDIFQEGINNTFPNATSASVTEGVPGFGPFLFGKLYVFDNPVTGDENMNSPPAARARGFYLYDRKDTPNTLFLITLSFNSSEYKGTMTMLGNNEHGAETRDIPIVGGTGDFFMARGIATLETEVLDFVKSYFRVRMDIKLYECY